MSSCDTPNEGCDCDVPGQVVDCGQVERIAGDYVSCSMGRRTCDAGQWGACNGDTLATLQAVASGRRTLALGDGQDCPDNPCDPYCRLQLDSPTGLLLPEGSDLVDSNGLQVVPEEVASSNGTCTSMTVTPSSAALTVTGFGLGAGMPGLVGEYFNQIDPCFTATVPCPLADALPVTWVPTTTRQDPNLDFNWQLNGPGVAGITANNFSVRWTGTLVAPETNPYTLCATTDDGVRVWIDGVRSITDWAVHAATQRCSSPLNWLGGSTHTIRFEYFQAAGEASASLTWSSPTIPTQPIPVSAFLPPIDRLSPIVTGSAQFQAALGPPNCFLGSPTPAWTVDRLDIASIDNNGLVALNSAIAGPLSVTGFVGQLSAPAIVNVAVNVVETQSAPTGTASAFQAAPAGTDAAVLLSPTPGMMLTIGLPPPEFLWDAQGAPASAVKISLRYPATGVASFDWSQIVPEGNPARAVVPAQIWKFFEQSARGQGAQISVQRLVGGVLLTPITTTINFSSAPMVPAVCHPVGAAAASSCEVDEDCCGGTDLVKTAACRFDTPIANPASRHCKALTGSCVAEADSCSLPTDCCAGLACVGALCVAPPGRKVYGPANYERLYQSDCPLGTKVVWRIFDWKAATPDTNSKLEFFAETQADPSAFAILPRWPTVVTASDAILLQTVSGQPMVNVNWIGAPVAELLDGPKMLKSQQYLKITTRFVPNDERSASPVLKEWRQIYSCVPAE